MVKNKKKGKSKCLGARQVISFLVDDYPEGFNWQHDDPMVITTIIHNYSIKRILVDEGSSVDILYNDTTASMGIKKTDLKPHEGSLIGFSDKHVLVKGLISLRVTFGT